MSKKIIDVATPLGYVVTCDRGQWYGHVVKGHPFMSKNRAAVEETLRKPEYIYESGEHPERHVFFGKSTLPTYGDKFYTKVVVKPTENGYNEETSGDTPREIVSAWNQLKAGGNVGEMIHDATQSGQKK